MTQQEARDALVAGSQASSATFVNVPRATLLIALGAAPKPIDEAELDDVQPGQPTQ